jgi:spermidine/putrescine transport system ATP-binding protein
MMVELRKIHEKVEGSFFYVTHNQEVAMTLSDRLAVMNEGQIEQVGTPEEVYREPASEFVADFIGDTNLFDGTVAKRNGATTVEFGGSEGFTFTTDRTVEGGDVTVSIRPEEFYLEDEGPGVRARVTERYFQGERTDYVVDPTEADLPTVEVTEMGKESRFSEGGDVRLNFDESSPVLFQ